MSFRRMASALLCIIASTAFAQPPHAKLVGTESASRVSGRYIVALHQDLVGPPGVLHAALRARDQMIEAEARKLVAKYGGRVLSTLPAGANGFAVAMSEGEAQLMASDPRVLYVEQAQQVHALAWGSSPQNLSQSEMWGLDRIDEKGTSTPFQYTYELDGSGVAVYVIDVEFGGAGAAYELGGGRTSQITVNSTPVTYSRSFSCASGGGGACGSVPTHCFAYEEIGPNWDWSDHGYSSAGVIGSRTYGVAKNANLISIGALCNNGNGDSVDVITALDRAQQHKQHVDNPLRNNPAVVNMSLGWAIEFLNESVSMRNEMLSAVQAGMVIVAAAGQSNDSNPGQSACNVMPARAGGDPATSGVDSLEGLPWGIAGVITVGAMDNRVLNGQTDKMTPWSNFGPCVDIFAPGRRIRSVVLGGGSEYSSGTSLAAPMVAGRVALYLESHWAKSPAAVEQEVKANASVISTGIDPESAHGSPNLLVFTLGNLTRPSVTISTNPTLHSYNGLFKPSWTSSGVATQLLEANNPDFTGQVVVCNVLSGSGACTVSGKPLGSVTYFRVRECNATFTECGQYSGTITASVIVPPKSYITLDPSSSSSSSGLYKLSWTKPAEIVTTQLERATNGSFNGVSVLVNNGSLSYDEFVTMNQTYYYRVKGCTAEGFCSYSDTVLVTTNIGGGTPSAPALTAMTYYCQGQADLSWTAAGGSRWEGQSSLNSNFSNLDQDFNISSTALSVNANATSWWRVRACNGSTCGAWSNSKKVTYYATCQ